MYGKSVFISVFSKYLEKENYKVLIIDTSRENNTISTIFEKIKENKISTNIDYIFLRENDFKNNYIYFLKIIEKNKEKYDFIFIDQNFEINSIFYKNKINICDFNLFLLEPNLIELKKSKKILEIIKYDFKISNKKTKIIINKINEFGISEEILKDIFSEYKIIGKINYNPNYNLFINKNGKYNLNEKNYKKILKNL